MNKVLAISTDMVNESVSGRERGGEQEEKWDRKGIKKQTVKNE